MILLYTLIILALVWASAAIGWHFGGKFGGKIGGLEAQVEVLQKENDRLQQRENNRHRRLGAKAVESEKKAA